MKLTMISAVWCPACLIMNKRMKEVIKDYPEWTFEKLDLDMDEEKTDSLNVGKTLPVYIISDDSNVEIRRLRGEKTVKQLHEELFDAK